MTVPPDAPGRDGVGGVGQVAGTEWPATGSSGAVSKEEPSPAAAAIHLVRIWDLPTRLFHWCIVVLIGASWLAQHEERMTLHLLAGYTMLALLLFRLVWGVIGSDSARFARFLCGPAAVVRHLRNFPDKEPDTEVGHNPAGGWVVVVMLVLLAVQVGTGLCANDSVSTQGPLADMVGSDTSDWLTHVHAVNFRLIEAVAVLHIVAIADYRLVKGHRLVRAMITGNKPLPGDVAPPRMVSPLLALAVFAAIAAGVWWWVGWMGS
jgi:cytochrome b